MKKLRFLFVLPVAALAWVGAAALSPVSAVAANSASSPSLFKAQGRIGKITWQGNTFLTTAQLNQALGLKPGDPYSKELLDAKLNNPADGSITSRYMNQGYLFFSVDPVVKAQLDGTTDLTFRIMEGRQARIGTITVKGNQKVSAADVLALVPLRSGELFSRAKLIASQKALAESGKFKNDDPLTKAFEGIQLNPQPVPRPTEATDLVNIEFVVTER